MTSGLNKIGSAEIKQGVKSAIDLVKANGVLYTRLAGAVSDKCSANCDAIDLLKSHGLPVLCDLRHLTQKLSNKGHIDSILDDLLNTFASKATYMQIISEFESIVENTVPDSFKARYLGEVNIFLNNKEI